MNNINTLNLNIFTINLKSSDHKPIDSFKSSIILSNLLTGESNKYKQTGSPR